MIHSTKGTIQIVFDAKPTPIFKVIITPTHSSKISVGVDNFILFIQTPVPSTSSPATLLFRKDAEFTVTDDSARSMLITAASGALCVELQIDNGNPTEIIGIVFPASNK